MKGGSGSDTCCLNCGLLTVNCTFNFIFVNLTLFCILFCLVEYIFSFLCATQRQTAVTVPFASKQLLLLVFTGANNTGQLNMCGCLHVAVPAFTAAGESVIVEPVLAAYPGTHASRVVTGVVRDHL